MALFLSLAIGVGGALVSNRVGVMHGIGVAITGGMIIPVLVVLVLLLTISFNGGCLGADLG